MAYNNDESDEDLNEVSKFDPFATLAKSTMNLANCKKDYFNNKNCFESIFPLFDTEGYSIHRGYYKYNIEFSNVPFIRRNVVTGIIQSMDLPLAHKYLFGVFKLYTNKVLECMFITRGQEMITACGGDMVDMFDFNKLDITDQVDAMIISNFISIETGDDIEYYARFV